MEFISKYKTRKPEETVRIIKDFFYNKNLSIKETRQVSEVGTYSCVLKLYYKNIYILNSNGKGMSEELSLASGYAELYERFCNIPLSRYSYLFALKDYELGNKKKRDFDINGLKKWNIYKGCTYPEIKNNREDFYSKFYDGMISEVPYKNILTGEEEYFSEQLLYALNGSNGSAVGNSFDECFNAGFAELCERETQRIFFYPLKRKIQCYSEWND